MELDGEACYRALCARDGRFDGLFFVGVTTTGVYCRPVCPARTPGRARCVFFRQKAEAEREGFRACFRCRPELAPGSSAVDAVSQLVARAAARIEAGELNERTLDELSAELGVTARHLRRAMAREMGLSPIELAQSCRLSVAKQLLHDSELSLAEIAFESGFSSVRRFNAAFAARFGRPPSSLRHGSTRRQPAPGAAPSEPLSLSLGYREPIGWAELLRFFSARAVPGVEIVSGESVARTVRLDRPKGQATGWVRARLDRARRVVRVEASPSLAGALPSLSLGVRRWLDLDARPDAIALALSADPELAPMVRRAPGLRVPGALSGFEAAARAVLGQQVSVKAATTLATRLCEAFGERLEGAPAGLDRLFPSAARLAEAEVGEIARLGLPEARARALRALSAEVSSGRLDLSPAADRSAAVAALSALPGFGPWSLGYVAMRALGEPDAFPEGDGALKAALGGAPSAELSRRAEAWRPFRAYAALYLWESLTRGNT